MRVHIRPTTHELKENHGIGRVVHAQYQHLPKLGIELAGPDTSADVYAGHTQRFDMPRIDCLHCHGLYWSGDPGATGYRYTGWHHGVNLKIIEAAREAVAITVPSDWVAMPFKRDMRISPVVIGHGIEFDQWKPDNPGGYILWNKNRNTDVCDPTPAWELASRGEKVFSTFGLNKPNPDTLQVTGLLPSARMAELISHADIYLATTHETFGIGTLEAMACGVPVLGYGWGGTAAIVEHGVTGWLVKPGDTEALHRGLEIVRSQRDKMGQAAREVARAYDWPNVVEQYANLYHRIHEQVQNEPQGVSVIITCHNYEQWIGEAIESAKRQTVSPVEIIVVDDGSTDDSLAAIKHHASDPRVKVIAQSNQGVAAARTNGIRASTQEYLVCLDADDKLEQRFIEKLLPAICADRSLGIVYSGLSINYPDGGRGLPTDWPTEFSWASQSTVSNPPSNCIPSACIFRREMWERAGPHRQEYAPGEDAEFWTRGLSIGFRALRVTQEPLFWYRAHAKSASRVRTYRPIDDRMPWMRDHQYPMAAPLRDSIPPVRSYSSPLVSVVIPVGPGHARYLPDALDSLLGQTFREWEVIVIDDTWSTNNKGDQVVAESELSADLLRRYPFITYDLLTEKIRGASSARNAGLRLSQAPLVFFLDADDVLLPNALSEMLRIHITSGGRYVYTDYYSLSAQGQPIHKQVADYEQRVWLEDGLHAVSALVPKEWLLAISGFDVHSQGWEEGDLYTRLAIRGYCGVHLAQPLLVYRDYSGTRRQSSQAQSKSLVEQARKRYTDYLKGARQMSSCCGGNGETIQHAKVLLERMPAEVKVVDSAQSASARTVRMEYTGKRVGSITFFGRKREYRGGNNSVDRYADVDSEDVTKLEASGQWRRVVVVPAIVRPEQTTRPQWEMPAASIPEFPTEAEKALLGETIGR